MSSVDIPIHSPRQILMEITRRLQEKSPVVSVVCFDFFDTLVQRSVIPEDTKKIAACQLADLLGGGISGDLIYQIRQVIEQRVCMENHQKGYDLECNLTNVAGELAQVLRSILGREFGETVDSFTSLFIDIELAVERQVQILSLDVVEILRYCHAQGCKTAIISDYYMPSPVFNQLLVNHGLAHLVDYLFVSADYLMTKGHSGRLYDIARENIDCPAASMIMIGDNLHADGRMALGRGMQVYGLQEPVEQIVKARGMGIQKVDETVETVCQAAFTANQARYFPEMGLTLYYFIHHLFLQALQDQRDTLFFCSKEGEFLKKLFVRYQEIRFGRQVITSQYLVVSRKATYICSCKSLKEETFSGLFAHYRDLSLLEFLQSLNFSETESRTLCDSLQLEPSQRHHDLKHHQDYLTLLASPVFAKSYEEHRCQQHGNFLRYLESYGYDFNRKGIAMVDVGWKGSIQNNIYFALAGRVKVCGYYIGLLSPTEVFENNQKKGILFTDYPAHSPYIHVFNNNRSLFEMVLGASHGSADGYFTEEQWGAVSRLRQSNRYEKSGHALVTVLDLPEERKLYEEQILPLQEAYFALFAECAGNVVVKKCAPPDIVWFAQHHARMLFRPTAEEVEFFARLYHLENYGIFEFTTFFGSGTIPLRQRLDNLVRLWRNPTAILETGVWPPIILRRLGLSWIQPVDGAKRYRRIFKEQV